MACGKRCDRERMLSTCLKGAPRAVKQLMATGTGHLVDWKWEYMGRRLDALAARIPIILQYCDKEKLEQEARTCELAKSLHEALQTPDLTLGVEALVSVCKVVGYCGRYLKGCACHEHLLRPGMSTRRRLAAFRRAGLPSGSCPWVGRRGVELVHGGLDRMLQNIARYQSASLKQLIANTPKRTSHHVVRAALPVIKRRTVMANLSHVLV
jgi:hypothetical protein